MCSLLLILLLLYFHADFAGQIGHATRQNAHDIFKRLIETSTPCAPPALPRASMVGMSTMLYLGNGSKCELSHSVRALGRRGGQELIKLFADSRLLCVTSKVLANIFDTASGRTSFQPPPIRRDVFGSLEKKDDSTNREGYCTGRIGRQCAGGRS
jgi:hypothetical protein